MATSEVSNLKRVQPRLGNTQKQVLEAIRLLGKCHNRQIGQFLGWEINRVTGRVRELNDKGLIHEAGTVKAMDTNRTVTLWKIAG